jgi:hypothetical protein
MREMVEHPAYKRIESLSGVVLDYIILENDISYLGEESHKQAALEAMRIIAKRWDDYAFDQIKNDSYCSKFERKDFPTINIYDNKIQGKPYSKDQFFARPKDSYYIDKPKVKSRCWSRDQYSSYAYSFLEPPYRNPCLLKDWEELNNILFPNKDNLTIYSWNTEWSNYFKAGLEWWGAYYWTVYDNELNTFVVIGASTTD